MNDEIAYVTLAKVLSQPGTGEGNEERFNCPFCDDTKLHLYYNPVRNLYHCFRCEAKGYFKRVRRVENAIPEPEEVPPAQSIPVSAVPVGKGTPDEIIHFLAGKRVPYEICKQWFYETKLGEYRLYIPIFFQGKYVGYQARIIAPTGVKPNVKYLSSPGFRKSRALYNYDNVKASSKCVVVEGVFDCFLLPDTVAIFGKSISDFQTRCLAATFETVLLALDKDVGYGVQETANKLFHAGLEVEILRHKCGPYSLNSPADYTSQTINKLQVSNMIDFYLGSYKPDRGFVGEQLTDTKWWQWGTYDPRRLNI